MCNAEEIIELHFLFETNMFSLGRMNHFIKNKKKINIKKIGTEPHLSR